MELDRQIEILKLVKQRLTNLKGICDNLNLLYNDNIISKEEETFMLNLLSKHKPNDNQYTEFTKVKSWANIKNLTITSAYWWFPLSKYTRQIRIDYINAVINKLK